MGKHTILSIEIRDGNPRRIRSHSVATEIGAMRIASGGRTVWMTREVAKALGCPEIETFWGRFSNGVEFQIKTQGVIDDNT